MISFAASDIPFIYGTESPSIVATVTESLTPARTAAAGGRRGRTLAFALAAADDMRAAVVAVTEEILDKTAGISDVEELDEQRGR